jgi:hypothetical protein
VLLRRFRAATVVPYASRCPSYMKRRLRGATLLATRQRVYSPASDWTASKLATPITRRNKDAGQSATSLQFSVRHHRDEIKSLSFSSHGS